MPFRITICKNPSNEKAQTLQLITLTCFQMNIFLTQMCPLSKFSNFVDIITKLCRHVSDRYLCAKNCVGNTLFLALKPLRYAIS